MLIVAAAIPPLLARGQSPYAAWTNGPSTADTFFPIGVWLQSTSPLRIAQYQAAGFNVYVGLWQGPTESQLANLKAAGMYAACSQNATGLNSSNNDIIIAWMQQDEPDNAQWNEATQSYDPPILPSEIVNRYNTMKAADATRPVLLNLGQGVAWDGWWGRGTRTNHPEDYPLYCEGTDIVSFDIYPFAANDVDPRYAAIKDKPWLVPFGVDRLVTWTGQASPDPQIVWNAIECTNIHGYGEATPTQVKAEVWMSLIHGSMGIIYFVHEFDPFIEAGLLADPVMTAAVTATNNEIHSLAPVLNSPTLAGVVTVASSDPAVPVDLMSKSVGDDLYVFAVGMRDGTTTATFQLTGLPASGTVEVINEGRTIPITSGEFQDTFTPYAVHLYRTPLPVGPEILTWEVVADHGAAGVLASVVADGAVEPRIDGLRRLRITFDLPLDPTTVTESAIAVEALSNPGLLPGKSVSLDPSGKVLTVTFDSPLADADVYTVTVAGSVTGTDSLAVQGDLDIDLKTLAGDTDGSGAVSAADLLGTRAAAGTVTPANARFDVDLSGSVTGGDLLAIRARRGNTTP